MDFERESPGLLLKMKDLSILLNLWGLLLHLGTGPVAEIVSVVVISRRHGKLLVLPTELDKKINSTQLSLYHSFWLVMLLE